MMKLPYIPLPDHLKPYPFIPLEKRNAGLSPFNQDPMGQLTQPLKLILLTFSV